MDEAEVLYSDVTFSRGKREPNEAISSLGDTTYSEVKILNNQRSTTELSEAVSSSADATYSEVKISKTQPSTTELPESFQQVAGNRRSKVSSVKVALLVGSVLAAAIITFSVIIHKLQKQEVKCETENKNLTGEPVLICEEGWKEHGRKCYYFSISNSSWEESRKKCKAKGGDLVKIESEEEQKFLDKTLKQTMTYPEDKFWIGLTDSTEENKWLWVDDLPLNQSLAYWSEREPDNWKGENMQHPNGEDCARMGEQGETANVKCWFDAHCENLQKSICEKHPASVCP